ncbi:MAG: hypothetical protein IPK80_07675 [Nannocystis sp.]|nr:hypothetical protein [Nannocystis sp.]
MGGLMHCDEREDKINHFEAAAHGSWRRLQELVWGPRWDHTRLCLDFSEGSMHTLASWLRLVAEERSIERLEVALRLAGQYFGEAVQQHTEARWELGEDEMFGLVVQLRGGEERRVSVVAWLRAWVDAFNRADGSDSFVWIDGLHHAIDGALLEDREK